MKRNSSPTCSRRGARGVVLIEVLIAALIFTLGILGMVGVSAMGVGVQSDARYRTDASSITNELAQRIWVGVDRSSQAALRTSLLAFQHNETEATPCQFTGSDATANPVMADWIANAFDLESAPGIPNPHALPGSAANMVSVAIGDAAAFNRVTITVCWQTANDTAPRRHVLETWVN